MRILGFVFIGLTGLLLLIYIFLIPDAPMTSDYKYTYTWPFIIFTVGFGAGLVLILADWNVRRQKKGKVKH